MATASKVVADVANLVIVPGVLEGENYLMQFTGVKSHVPFHIKVLKSLVTVGEPGFICTEDDLQGKIDVLFEKAQKVFSHFDPESEVSKINSNESKLNNTDNNLTEFEISDYLLTVLETASYINRVSRGAFDPSIFPLNQAIKNEENLEAIMEISKYCSWQKCFKLEGNKLIKLHEKSKLDVLGLAKGFTVDEIVKMLVAEGFEDCYVDWGGEIKINGVHPSYPGKGWKVYVRSPPKIDFLQTHIESYQDLLQNEKETEYFGEVMLSSADGSCAFGTSGDYGQVVCRKDGTIVSHVINPVLDTNGKEPFIISPGNIDICQVSVCASSCMIADALATAALVLGAYSAKKATTFLNGFHNHKIAITNYLCYSRNGPRVVEFAKPTDQPEDVKQQRHAMHDPANIIVVGGGLAGLSAAIEAVATGATVTILDKSPKIGGNSMKASSGINGWSTRIQKLNNVIDEEKYFERDTYRSGKEGICNTSLVRTLSSQSADAVHWLMDTFDLPLTVLAQLGGHSKKRTHRAPPKKDGTPVPVGWLIMDTLAKYIKNNLNDKITILTEKTVIKLNYKEFAKDRDYKHVPHKKVTGVQYTEKTEAGEDVIVSMDADAVILTTGGFGSGIFKDSNGNGMRNEYRPDLAKFPTTNGAFATGDGMRIASEIGANLIDMDKVQLHPTGLLNPKDPGNTTKFLGPEALRGSGGILLDHNGNRFVNELDLRSVVSKAIIENCKGFPLPDGTETLPYAFCVLNEESCDKFGKPYLSFYRDKLGLAENVKGLGSLAEFIGCDVENIKKTLQDYHTAFELGICEHTKKSFFPSDFDCTESGVNANFVVCRVTPSVHYCMGGLQINAACEVQEKIQTNIFGKMRHIRNLFAAGEVTGGVHGSNRLGGNSLLECVVFGRIAGERAATIKQKKKACLEEDKWIPVTLRETRLTDTTFGGINNREFRFNLHGSKQISGMEIGQYIGIRGNFEGDTIQSYYSPITRPTDEGVLAILCRIDEKGGPIANYLNWMRPGHGCYIKAMGGLRLFMEPSAKEETKHFVRWRGRNIKKLVLLAGGTGIAPMVQIIRAYLRFHDSCDIQNKNCLRLIYAAEESQDLAFGNLLNEVENRFSDVFRHYIVLNQPPLGWIHGVGFVDADTIRKHGFYPPEDGILYVICGPPVFERIMVQTLKSLGFTKEHFYAYSEIE